MIPHPSAAGDHRGASVRAEGRAQGIHLTYIRNGVSVPSETSMLAGTRMFARARLVSPLRSLSADRGAPNGRARRSLSLAEATSRALSPQASARDVSIDVEASGASAGDHAARG